MDFRLADPKYTGFVPKTAQEAILKFRRLQDTGISAWKYPEMLVECGGNLSGTELDRFHDWIVTPQGVPKDCVDVSVFSVDNEKTHAALLKAAEERRPQRGPSVEDEKADA